MKIFNATLTALLTGLALGVSSPDAFAQNFDCLLQARGKEVLWDKDWQRDSTDHNVRYKVEQVTDKDVRHAPREIVLELAAVGDATKPRRTATIVKDLAAKLFCDRLSAGPARALVMAVPSGQSAPAAMYAIDSYFPHSAAGPESLVYRVWKDGAWKPARPSPGEQLFVCETKTVAVACNREDFERLRLLREDGRSTARVSSLLKLPGAFLRFGNAGWSRDLPLGPLAEMTVAECALAGKMFYCLTDEKTRWRSELKELEKELDTQSKMADAGISGFVKRPPATKSSAKLR